MDSRSSKGAVILHGTDAHPVQAWQPWLREQFERRDYRVLHPELPENHRPSKQTYNEFLLGQNWDYTDNILVGHSSGTTAILNLLAEKEFPRVRVVVMVAAFLVKPTSEQATEFGFETDQFDALFPPGGFDWAYLRKKCESFYFVHSADDPYCPVVFAEEAAQKLDGQMIYIENGGHLGARSGLTELPSVVTKLEVDGVL